MMQDISEDELKELERSSSKKVQNNNESDDRQLIEMVQRIKAGEKPKIIEPIETPNRLVEPEEQKSFVNPLKNNDMINNSNFWKIQGLPSNGKFYPEGTEILGRPMKVLEVKKISSINENNGDFILNDIIKRTVTGIDTNDLYVADKLYIIFWLRANTYRDSGYIVPFVCPKCEKKSDYHFDVDSLEVQYVDDDFDPNKEISLNSGEKITFDYLRIKDEIYIDRFKELNYKTIGEIDEELLAMAQAIKTINGKTKTLLAKYHWIIELNPGDYSFLKTYMEKKGMGIKPFVTIECKECGGTASVAVSFREEFVIPEYKFE
jgi:hypothetical protein